MIKMYKEKAVVFADKDQIAILESLGWSKNKPADKPADKPVTTEPVKKVAPKANK